MSQAKRCGCKVDFESSDYKVGDQVKDNFDDDLKTIIVYCPLHLSAERVSRERKQFLEAVKAQHEAIDQLFAWLIESRAGFLPSKCGQPWEACLLGNKVLTACEKGEQR